VQKSEADCASEYSSFRNWLLPKALSNTFGVNYVIRKQAIITNLVNDEIEIMGLEKYCSVFSFK
jgi:hypothetical protein